MNHDDYRKGWEAGFVAGYQHAHDEKEPAPAKAGVPALKPVYQGRSNLCASCGNPVGDSPVQNQEYDHVFLYCSDNCRDYHALGA